MFMVTTDTGKRTFDDGHGMLEPAALAIAQERNAAAQQLGIATRYVVAPFVRKA